MAVTFARAGQVATISPNGQVDIVATFPDVAPDGSPIGYRLLTGVAATNNGFEVLAATGDPATNGLWRTEPDGAMDLIAALPADGLPNGPAIDPDTGARYVADSTIGAIHRIDAEGAATIWFDTRELAPDGRLGANGIKVHDGAAYASNLDSGSITRVCNRDRWHRRRRHRRRRASIDRHPRRPPHPTG